MERLLRLELNEFRNLIFKGKEITSLHAYKQTYIRMGEQYPSREVIDEILNNNLFIHPLRVIYDKANAYFCGNDKNAIKIPEKRVCAFHGFNGSPEYYYAEVYYVPVVFFKIA